MIYHKITHPSYNGPKRIAKFVEKMKAIREFKSYLFTEDYTYETRHIAIANKARELDLMGAKWMFFRDDKLHKDTLSKLEHLINTTIKTEALYSDGPITGRQYLYQVRVDNFDDLETVEKVLSDLYDVFGFQTYVFKPDIYLFLKFSRKESKNAKNYFYLCNGATSLAPI